MTSNWDWRAAAALCAVMAVACGGSDKKRTSAPLPPSGDADAIGDTDVDADSAVLDVEASLPDLADTGAVAADDGAPPSEDVAADLPAPDAAPDTGVPLPSCGVWSPDDSSPAGPGDGDFPWGVVSAEIRETTARIWVATEEAATVTVWVSAGPECSESSASGKTTASTGFTAEIPLAGLEPWTVYRYRAELKGGAGLTSPGWLVTMPVEDVPLRVAISGDVTLDSSLYGIFADVIASGSLLYIHQGDWPYTDSDTPATTLSDYREKHAEARAFSELRELFRFLPMNGNWDDHEVANDWDGADAEKDPDRVAAGMQAWKEWFPAVGDAPGEIYRRYHLGPNVEAFQLDCRSHRSANAAPNDALKTMLGDQQLAWLLAGLSESTAAFKLLLTSVPLDYGTTGNDHWPGFMEEREAILDHIRDEHIPGVVFFTADQHWLAVHDMPHGPKEFQTGPLAGFTRTPLENPPPEVLLENEIQNFGTIDYEPGPPPTLVFSAWAEGGELLYTETIPAGVGSIDVAPSLAQAGWTISGEHVFTGKGPTSLPWATPGTYTILWQSAAGAVPPPPETLTLPDGGTIAFAAEYGDVDPDFLETFSAASLAPTWTVVEQGEEDPTSSWSVSGGTAREIGNCYDAKLDEAVVPKLGTFLWAKKSSFGEGTLEARTLANDDDGWGLMYGIQNATTYYRFSMDHQRSYARLVRDDGGTFTVLAEDLGYLPNLGTWTTITIVRDGAAHDVFVDGVLVLSATDSTYPTGSIGLYSWGMDDLRFDDVAIYP